MHTLYDVLEVSQKASQEVIKMAYKALCKKYHPDVYHGGDSDEKMKLINRAYEILSDESKRKQYDAMIGVGSSQNYKETARETSQKENEENVSGEEECGENDSSTTPKADKKKKRSVIVVVAAVLLVIFIIIPFFVWENINSYYKSEDYLNALKAADSAVFCGVFSFDVNGIQENSVEKLYDRTVGVYRYRSTSLLYGSSYTNYDDLTEIFKYLYEKHNHTQSLNYLQLIDCRVNSEYERTYGSYTWLDENLNFEDAKEILLFRFEDAAKFLEGKWKTDDGVYYFNLSKDGNDYETSIYLPFSTKSGSFTINQGVYYVDDEYTFAIKILSENEIWITNRKSDGIHLFRK